MTQNVLVCTHTFEVHTVVATTNVCMYVSLCLYVFCISVSDVSFGCKRRMFSDNKENVRILIVFSLHVVVLLLFPLFLTHVHGSIVVKSFETRSLRTQYHTHSTVFHCADCFSRYITSDTFNRADRIALRKFNSLFE